MTRRAYRRFSKEFKLEAIRLAKESGKPMAQVARELGIRVNQIGKWRKELEEKQEEAFSGNGRRHQRTEFAIKGKDTVETRQVRRVWQFRTTPLCGNWKDLPS